MASRTLRLVMTPFCLAFQFQVCLAADPGDDISNNLGTDLAPFLTLLGERATMQFLSQATGWSDCVMLAMAPLGIVTIIVSAIRVGGPSWLKTLVGRARESMSIVEIELLSSTSEEVCELWNGTDVVRCHGKSPLVEFICLLPEKWREKRDDWKKPGSEPRIKIMTLQDAQFEGVLSKSSPDDGHLNRQSDRKPKSVAAAKLKQLFPYLKDLLRKILLSKTRSDDTQHRHDEEQQMNAMNVNNGGRDTDASDDLDQQVRGNTARETSGGSNTTRTDTTSGSDVEEDTIVLVYDPTSKAPNLTLNRKVDSSRVELRILATFGLLLQLGIISFFCCLNYNLKFQKEGSFVMAYGLPCAVVGTALLNFGLFLCGHVVEASTTETTYSPNCGRVIFMIWLQQETRVSEQLFKSSAIYSRKPLPSVSFSSRNPTPTRPSTGLQRWGLETLAVLSTAFSVVGFSLQFVGLRAMHWLASIVQLGGILLMTAVRAYARRGLAEPLESQPLLPGLELHWLAIMLTSPKCTPWLRDKTDNGKTSDSGDREAGREQIQFSWSNSDRSPHFPPNESSPCRDQPENSSSQDVSRLMKRVNPLEHLEGSDEERIKIPKLDYEEDIESWPKVVERGGKLSQILPSSNNSGHSVLQILKEMRNGLARRKEWRDRALDEARRLKRAMEGTMNLLFPSLEMDLEWTAGRVSVSPHCSEEIRIKLTKSGIFWEVDEAQINAALCLYLYPALTSSAPAAAGYDADSHLDVGPQETGLRILGPSTPSLRRELKWWMPHGGPTLLEVEYIASSENLSDVLKVKRQWIVSCSSVAQPWSDLEANALVQFHVTSWSRSDVGWDSQQRENKDGDARTPLLAVWAADSLEVLYATDLLSRFLGAAARTDGCLNMDSCDMASFDSLGWSGGGARWETFRPRSDEVSNLAARIEEAHLSSLHDAYLSIIPTLSQGERLPTARAMFEVIRARALKAEQRASWYHAAEIYLSLWREAELFPKESHVYAKSAAVLMDFTRRLTASSTLCMTSSYEILPFWIQTANNRVRNMFVATVCPRLLQWLGTLYVAQGRLWACRAHLDKYSNNEDLEKFRHILWSAWVDSDRLEAARELACQSPAALRFFSGSQDTASRDVFDRTPQHYAAVGPNKEIVFDSHEGDVGGWTPLYNCLVSPLGGFDRRLNRSVSLDVRACDGVTPLHCIAINWNSLQSKCDRKSSGWMQYSLERNLGEWAAICSEGLCDASGRGVAHYVALGPDRSPSQPEWIVAACSAKQGLLADDRQRTAMHVAAATGHSILGEKSMRDALRAKDEDGRTPLHCAVRAECSRQIKALMDIIGAEPEPDLNPRDNCGETPLHLASRNSGPESCRLLIQGKADVQARNKEGQTPLHVAAIFDREHQIAALLEGGADIEARDDEGNTPLHLACQSPGLNSLPALLDKTASVDAVNNKGETPLHIAAGELASSSAEKVRLLLGRKADPRAVDKRGRTPLHTLSTRRPAPNTTFKEFAQWARDQVKALIDGGADMGDADHVGRSPLHRAARRCRSKRIVNIWCIRSTVKLQMIFEMPRILIENGASVDATDKNGNTPLHLAAMLPTSASPMDCIMRLCDMTDNIRVSDEEFAFKPSPLATTKIQRLARELLRELRIKYGVA